MQEIKDSLKGITQSQARVEIDIAMIKVDIAHHITRTGLNEKRIERTENWILGLASALVAGVIGWLLRR